MNSEDTVATLTGAKPNGHEAVAEYEDYGELRRASLGGVTSYHTGIPPAGTNPSGPEMEQLPDGKGWAVKKDVPVKYDPITRPEHYCKGDIEPWEFIEAQSLGFHEGSAVSYIARARHKGDEIGDLRKAINFLSRKVKLLERPAR